MSALTEHDTQCFVGQEQVDRAARRRGDPLPPRLGVMTTAFRAECRVAEAPEPVAGHAGDDEDHQTSAEAVTQIFHRAGKVLRAPGANDEPGNEDVEQSPHDEPEARQPLKLAFAGEILRGHQDNAAACSRGPVDMRFPSTSLKMTKAISPNTALATWISQKVVVGRVE